MQIVKSKLFLSMWTGCMQCSGSLTGCYCWEKGTCGSVSKKTNRFPKPQASSEPRLGCYDRGRLSTWTPLILWKDVAKCDPRPGVLQLLLWLGCSSLQYDIPFMYPNSMFYSCGSGIWGFTCLRPPGSLSANFCFARLPVTLKVLSVQGVIKL